MEVLQGISKLAYSRLRVFGSVQKDWTKVSNTDILDLACLENGGRAISCSNAHYGQPMNLLSRDPSKGTLLSFKNEGMFDGWETARNINRPKSYEYGADGHLIIPGSENTVIKLGHEGIVTKIEIEVNKDSN